MASQCYSLSNLVTPERMLAGKHQIEILSASYDEKCNTSNIAAGLIWILPWYKYNQIKP